MRSKKTQVHAKAFNTQLEKLDDPRHRPAHIIREIYRRWRQYQLKNADYIIPFDIETAIKDNSKASEEFIALLTKENSPFANGLSKEMSFDYFLTSFDPRHRSPDEVRQFYRSWIKYLNNGVKNKSPFVKAGYFGKYYPGMQTVLTSEFMQDELRQTWFWDYLNAADETHLSLKIAHSYWLEKFDPHHRKAAVVRNLYMTWAAGIHKTYTNIPTEAGRSTFLKNSQLDVLPPKTLNIERIRVNPSLKIAFKQYLIDSSDTKAESIIYPLDNRSKTVECVTIKNGQLFEKDSDTLINTTQYRGKQNGYAAYVIDLEGNLYINPHKVGQYHHSSFIGGKKVLCAGMIKVIDGKIRNINTNSGHYKPSNLHLAFAVEYFKKHDLFESDDDFGKKSLVLRKLLLPFDSLGLFQRGPKVTFTYRSRKLEKLTNACLHSRFLPIYWIGRGLDALRIPIRFPLSTYRDIYCPKYRPEYQSLLTKFDPTKNEKNLVKEKINIDPDLKLKQHIVTSGWRQATTRQAIIAYEKVFLGTADIHEPLETLTTIDTSTRKAFENSSSFENRRIHNLNLIKHEQSLLKKHNDATLYTKISDAYELALHELQYADTELMLKQWENKYRKQPTFNTLNLDSGIELHRFFLQQKSIVDKMLCCELKRLESLSKNPTIGFWKHSIDLVQQKRQALEIAYDDFQNNAVDILQLRDKLNEIQSDYEIIMHTTSNENAYINKTALHQTIFDYLKKLEMLVPQQEERHEFINKTSQK